MSTTNYYDVDRHLSRKTLDFMFQNVSSVDKTNPLFVERMVTYATMHVPAGSTIRTNLENSESDLKFIPVAAPLIVGVADNTAYHCLDFYTFCPNATQTVYLTRTNPIEFTYIDTSIKRSFTIVTIDPVIVSNERTEHPGYYCLFAVLSIVADIATSPFQAIGLLFIWGAYSRS